MPETMKKKSLPIRASLESPTWGNLQQMAETVIEKLGGQEKAAAAMSYESYYTLTVLASLRLDETKQDAPIFGKRHLT